MFLFVRLGGLFFVSLGCFYAKNIVDFTLLLLQHLNCFRI